MQTLLFPVYRRTVCAIEIPESRKNIGITCKVNNNLMTIAPNPPSTPQRNGKQLLLAVDCRQLYFRFVVIFPPKFEKTKFSTSTGIRPKSNKNSELKKKYAAKRRNSIEVNRKWSGLYANVTTSGSPLNTARNSKYRNY